MNQKVQKRNPMKGESVDTTGVHADQALFVQKLKVVKRYMYKVKLVYRGEELSLWDFTGM